MAHNLLHISDCRLLISTTVLSRDKNNVEVSGAEDEETTAAARSAAAGRPQSGCNLVRSSKLHTNAYKAEAIRKKIDACGIFNKAKAAIPRHTF
jgi:hypothetical protein